MHSWSLILLRGPGRQGGVCLRETQPEDQGEAEYLFTAPVTGWRLFLAYPAHTPKKDLRKVDDVCNQKFFFVFLVFLGLHPWHTEVSGLGVNLELQLLAYATAHRSTGSLTH